MNEQANREQLAKAVMAARLRKYKTIQRAHVAAGVARGTWEKVERGDKIKVFSLAAIEEALDWPAGRAQAILDGQDPAARGGGHRLADLIDAYQASHPTMTDAAIADAIGVELRTVRGWRTRGTDAPPSPDTLRRLAGLLGKDYESVVLRAVLIDVGWIEPDWAPPSPPPPPPTENPRAESA